MKKSTLFVLVAAWLWASSSHAVLMVKIEDLGAGTTTIISDNIDTGLVQYSSVNGSGTSINLTAASYNPFGGDAFHPLSCVIGCWHPTSVPSLELSGSIINSSQDVDLRVSISDTDFSYYTASIGRTYVSAELGASQHVIANYFYNTSNLAFDVSGATNILFDTNNGSAMYNYGLPDNRVEVQNSWNHFSLTQIINIHADAGTAGGFNSRMYVLPEPSALLLCAIGLFVLLAGRGLNN